MKNNLSKILSICQFITRRMGFFVVRYKPDYVYVERTQLWGATPYFYSRDRRSYELFYTVASPVIESGRTLFDYNRLYTLWNATQDVLKHVKQYNHQMKPIPIAEIGVYKGGSSYFLASAFQHLLGYEVPMHVFDTFEGHPSRLTKDDPGQVEGGFGDTNYDEVKAYLAPFKRLEVHKGEISESVKILPEIYYGLVHIDVDSYLSTLDCLRYFGSRIAPGGVMIIDDFNTPMCPGVKKAVLEYLEENKGFKVGYCQTEQLVLVKRYDK